MSDDDATLTTAEPDTGAAPSSEPVQETAAPETSAASGGETAQGDQPATAAPGTPTDAAGSLTPPHSQTNPQPQTPSVDWEKRYRDLMSQTDRRVNDWRSRMETQGRQMAELERFKQEQEQRAKAASLKRYNKEHPEHAKFQSLLQRRDMASKQLAALHQRGDLTPEQKAAMAEIIRNPLSEDELREVMEFEEYGKSFQRELAIDPRSAIAPIIRDEFRSMFQQEMQRMQAQHAVQQDFNDPALKPLIEKHRDDVAKAMQDGVPYDYTLHMLRMNAEIDRLREELKTATGKSVQADERMRLVKGEAAITRDSRPPKRDPYQQAKAEAAEKGITPDSPAFAAILAKYG